MTLDPDQRIISADDHMDIHALPPELFEERLPAALRDVGPRVVETENGPFWQAEGRLLSPSGNKGKGYIGSADHGLRPGRPETRLEDMDRDGVFAHVIYSPMTTQMRISDAELRAACMRAYNDWAVDFNGVDPRRLLLLSHLPGHDPKAAAAILVLKVSFICFPFCYISVTVWPRRLTGPERLVELLQYPPPLFANVLSKSA